MTMLLRAVTAFCVATVITQVILVGFFVIRGSFNKETATKIVALLNGIDISGNRLRTILRESEDREQPDFDEILEARKMESLDMDMRLRSQNEFRDDLSKMLAELRVERKRFDERRGEFEQKLAEIRQGAQEEGLKEVQRTLQSLDAEQAKDQLLRIYDDERIDDVVNIVQAMPTDKRKDILAEFVSPDESDKLADILRRIGEGIPTTSLINQVGGGR